MNDMIIKPYKRWKNIAIIPNWLLERKDISSGAKLVYARLCQFSGKNEKCYPSIKTLAKAVGCGVTSCRKHINELKKNHLIKVKRLGLRCNNRYYFLQHDWMAEDRNNFHERHMDEFQENYTGEFQENHTGEFQENHTGDNPIAKESREKN